MQSVIFITKLIACLLVDSSSPLMSHKICDYVCRMQHAHEEEKIDVDLVPAVRKEMKERGGAYGRLLQLRSEDTIKPYVMKNALLVWDGKRRLDVSKVADLGVDLKT